MFLLRENYQHPAFRQGVMDMAGAAPGIAAWGLMTGVAMVKSGMGTFEALPMALTVFAGSSQLAALPLMLGGAPMWVVLVTGFCVNLRFVVFRRAHAGVCHAPAPLAAAGGGLPDSRPHLRAVCQTVFHPGHRTSGPRRTNGLPGG